MIVLRVFFFRRLQIFSANSELEQFNARKVEELFTYLVLHRHQPQQRDIVADLLWGEATADKPRLYLRKTLSQLQNTFQHQKGSAKEQVILTESEWIQLNPEIDLWSDAEVFENAFQSVHGTSGHELTFDQVGLLQNAVDLYTGDLLEGWYQNWCVCERERFQYMYLAMLDKLLSFHEFYQEYEAAITFGNQILQYDRARERTHRHLMRLYFMSGDRTAALRQYERCVTTLFEEFNVEPDAQTINLYEQVRLTQPGYKSGVVNISKIERDVQLCYLYDHLEHFEEVLSQIQRQVQRDKRLLARVMDQKL